MLIKPNGSLCTVLLLLPIAVNALPNARLAELKERDGSLDLYHRAIIIGGGGVEESPSATHTSAAATTSSTPVVVPPVDTTTSTTSMF